MTVSSIDADTTLNDAETKDPTPRRPSLALHKSRRDLMDKLHDTSVLTLDAEDKKKLDESFEVFDPRFRWLMRCATLWSPDDARYPFFEKYVLPLMYQFCFISCIFVCGIRSMPFMDPSGPAIYNRGNNFVFVLFHIWLIYAYFKMRRLVLSRFFVAGVGNATMNPERKKDIKALSRWYGTLGMWMAGVIIPWIMIAWGAGFANPHYTSPQKFMTLQWFFVYASFAAFSIIVFPW